MLLKKDGDSKSSTQAISGSSPGSSVPSEQSQKSSFSLETGSAEELPSRHVKVDFDEKNWISEKREQRKRGFFLA